MDAHLLLTDQEFETQVEQITMDPQLFSHEAHLRLAWIHIRKYGIEQAIENICRQINAFARFHGDHDKYNETVTITAIRAVYHFITRSKTDRFEDFIKENGRLKSDFRSLIASHYSTDIFKDETAKRQFVAPDLTPFD